MKQQAQRPRLRASEWLLLCYFAYVAVLWAAWRNRTHQDLRPLWILLAVSILLLIVARTETYFGVPISYFRDFLPLGLTLVAFEEMNLFATRHFDSRLEQAWIRWDHVLLHNWHLHAAIESLGFIIPLYLELCYLLVYGLGTYCVVVLYLKHRRQDVDRFFLVCLTGTLLAYALFPFFPSQPPRVLFSGLDAPSVSSWVRRFNVWILSRAGIQIAVFPSAHVSSAFSAAWAMFLLLAPRKRYGWGVLVYAISVSIATIYGRYHYAADVAAGFAVSMVAAALCFWLGRARKTAE